MSARHINGWIEVDCDAPDTARVHIRVKDGEWQPAFRDYSADGKRVAKIRPPLRNKRVKVQLRVGDHVTDVGSISV